MRFSELFGLRVALLLATVAAVALVGWLFAYEPVTRNFVASDFVCSYCHLEREYDPAARMPYT
ncbi:MAG: hypothetical protein ACTSU0_07955, partial [Alphaproteobacteria bacterium]